MTFERWVYKLHPGAADAFWDRQRLWNAPSGYTSVLERNIGYFQSNTDDSVNITHLYRYDALDDWAVGSNSYSPERRGYLAAARKLELEQESGFYDASPLDGLNLLERGEGLAARTAGVRRSRARRGRTPRRGVARLQAGRRRHVLGILPGERPDGGRHLTARHCGKLRQSGWGSAPGRTVSLVREPGRGDGLCFRRLSSAWPRDGSRGPAPPPGQSANPQSCSVDAPFVQSGRLESGGTSNNQ
jgi:hypothetical protein